MLEIGIVLATLTLLAAGSVSAPALSPDLLLRLGFWTVVAGLGFGLPTGALYHVGLHRSLVRAGRLPRRWWLHPTSHHRLLPPEDAPSVLAWCRAGALGCGVVFLGCALAALGVWRVLA
ncbi:MAG TPA: hypothetical protein VHQ66_10430 [Myxococcota bacterium]|nr:hypothetical protein [Myxococcota bacterium]